MNSFLDTLWEKIAAGLIALGNGFDAAVTPFHFLGPVVIIFLLAILTVLITKSLNRIIITKRYVQLEKEFKHWYHVRREAMACEDLEKGKAMAKNIDQAKLNKAYYDYFFESLLLGLARSAMPILLMVAYINEYFRAERLTALFGRNYIFKFNSSGGEPILMGVVFWYILSLLIAHLAWFIIKKCYRRFKKNDSLKAAPASDLGKNTAK